MVRGSETASRAQPSPGAQSGAPLTERPLGSREGRGGEAGRRPRGAAGTDPAGSRTSLSEPTSRPGVGDGTGRDRRLGASFLGFSGSLNLVPGTHMHGGPVLCGRRCPCSFVTRRLWIEKAEIPSPLPYRAARKDGIDRNSNTNRDAVKAVCGPGRRLARPRDTNGGPVPPPLPGNKNQTGCTSPFQKDWGGSGVRGPPLALVHPVGAFLPRVPSTRGAAPENVPPAREAKERRGIMARRRHHTDAQACVASCSYGIARDKLLRSAYCGKHGSQQYRTRGPPGKPEAERPSLRTAFSIGPWKPKEETPDNQPAHTEQAFEKRPVKRLILRDLHPKKGEKSPDKKIMMELPTVTSQENGLSQILKLVLKELSLFYSRDVNGVSLLYDLLHSPWLQALLKVYECLQEYITKKPVPVLAQAQALSCEVVELLQDVPQSPEVQELRHVLKAKHFQALLNAHDTVAQKDFEPVLPPLPDDIPENEEALRIVCLVKNKQPLGATIKRHEITGDIMVARIIHGGLADRSGLLYAGDKLVEVNGISVDGLEPEQVIHILAMSHGTIMFKVIPVSDRPTSNQTMVYVRTMAKYCPWEDPIIPCADAGLPFQKGEILQIVDQNDSLWWQARKVSDFGTCAGLIPSNHLLKRKQREFWWSQPFQPQTCLKSTILNTMAEEEDIKIDEKCVEEDEETFQSEELSEDEEEFAGYDHQFFIAGFRRSMRLCRRKSHTSQQPASCCTTSCYNALGAPYEEVVRYQRCPSDKHRLIVLVGPSGVGVNELRRRLIEMNPNHFQSAVPHTTRSKKSYEENGREYHYVSKETFESLVYGHRMLEYGEYKGNLYGTSVDAVRKVLNEGKVCVMDLEPQNIQVARTHELKPYVIFIKPSTLNRMKQSRKNARIITDYYVNIQFKVRFRELESCMPPIIST
ncbi:MAGUK p55 subfamily member 4 [Gracilinanus agilis]|uniref:MAGUK p55 subfamily member 4 n=1 Tax=Gracilinanus agilis TaxID=191870 RepID=UPI001CFDAE40|nr:MAGUK p55 subfamily member 4 [Gracilinanus agilis]